MSLDGKIDDLYRQPPDAFVTARNALAKTLTGDDAKRVRALVKPTVVPWAVNQVYWQARPTYDKLLKSGERLRAAQIASLEGRRGADVREAGDSHRTALADAVKAAERIAARRGREPAGGCAHADIRDVVVGVGTARASGPFDEAAAAVRVRGAGRRHSRRAACRGGWSAVLSRLRSHRSRANFGEAGQETNRGRPAERARG